MSDRRGEQRRREQRRPPKGLRYVVYAGLALVAVLMLALAASVFVFGSGPAGPDYPGANFEFQYHESNRTLVVSHAGGQNLTGETTDRVTVTVDGTETARFALPVVEGQGVRLDGVDPGRRVEVVWYGRDGASIEVARTVTGEDDSTTGTATPTGTTGDARTRP